MNRCPFCNSEFEKKDVLFFYERDANSQRLNVSGNSRRGVASTAASATDTPSARRSRLSLDSTMGGRPAGASAGGGRLAAAARPAEPVPAESEPAPQEQSKDEQGAVEKTRFGEWAIDDINEDFKKQFLKGSRGKKERFIVRWSPDTGAPGTAKAGKMSSGFPITVQLCEEDKEKSNMNGLMTRIMCPHCHSALKPDLMNVDAKNYHSIALIGHPSSGKTEFKLAIMDELSNLRARYSLCTEVKTMTASEDFGGSEKEDFKDGEAKATPAKAVVFPMVFTIKNNDSMHVITIYDMPGEVFLPDESHTDDLMLQDQFGISNCDAALLMVDASQLDSSAARKPKCVEKSVEGENGITKKFENVLSQHVSSGTLIQDPLSNFKTFGIGSKIEYLSIVVTKCDLLIGKFGQMLQSQTYLKQLKVCHSDAAEDHYEHVNKMTINAVDDQTMRVIRESQNYLRRKDVKQDICNMIPSQMLRAENIRAFMVSSLRRPNPESTDFIVSDSSTYPRHRVLEPILYLLARWNVVPSTPGDWGTGSCGTNAVPDAAPTTEEDDNDTPKRHGLFGWRRGRK